MATTYNKLIIEINKPILDVITAVQNDTNSRFLDVEFYSNNTPINLTGQTVRMYAIKPDGKEVFNDGIIKNATSGRVQFELTSQTLSTIGYLKVQFTIFEQERKILSTQTFNIFITKNLMSDNAIKSSNEYDSLVLLFQKVYDTIELMKKIDTTTTEIKNKTISIEKSVNSIKTDTTEIKDAFKKDFPTAININRSYLDAEDIRLEKREHYLSDYSYNFSDNNRGVIHFMVSINVPYSRKKASQSASLIIQGKGDREIFKTGITRPYVADTSGSNVNTSAITLNLGFINGKHLSTYRSDSGGNVNSIREGFREPFWFDFTMLDYGTTSDNNRLYPYINATQNPQNIVTNLGYSTNNFADTVNAVALYNQLPYIDRDTFKVRLSLNVEDIDPNTKKPQIFIKMLHCRKFRD